MRLPLALALFLMAAPALAGERIVTLTDQDIASIKALMMRGASAQLNENTFRATVYLMDKLDAAAPKPKPEEDEE